MSKLLAHTYCQFFDVYYMTLKHKVKHGILSLKNNIGTINYSIQIEQNRCGTYIKSLAITF